MRFVPAACLTLCLIAPVLARGEEALADRLDDLPPADVVILGEVHDNPIHHVNQGRAVKALQPKAIVFEMLTPEQVAAAEGANRHDPHSLGPALGWDNSGWPDFAMYWPIFAAAPEARLYGAGVDRTAARSAMKDGAASFFGAEAGAYGLAAPLAADLQARLEAEQMQAHCNAMPADMMAGMVEVQRLRDATLARAAAQAVEETGGPVAVITGSGHARTDVGVPAVLASVAPQLRVLSIGQVERDDAASEGLPYDMWVVTEPVSREDPCLSLTGE